MRGSLKKSAKPAGAANSAITIAVPINHIDTLAQTPSPVPMNARSVTNAPTRNATGNGISIG